MSRPTHALHYTQIAREIAQQQRWSAAAEADFSVWLLRAILQAPPAVRSWGAHSGLPRHKRVLHMVHPNDVNYWIRSQGLEYQWKEM